MCDIDAVRNADGCVGCVCYRCGAKRGRMCKMWCVRSLIAEEGGYMHRRPPHTGEDEVNRFTHMQTGARVEDIHTLCVRARCVYTHALAHLSENHVEGMHQVDR